MPTPTLPPSNTPPTFERRQTVDPWKEWGITRDSLKIIISRDSLAQAAAAQADSASKSSAAAYAAESARAKYLLDKALSESPWLKSKSSDWAKSVAQGASTLDPKSANALSSILMSEQAAKLTVREQKKLLDIFKVLGPLGRQELATAVPQITPGTNTSILLDRDYQGRTFLSHIHSLCSEPLDFRIGLDDERLSRKNILLSILREAGRPNGIRGIESTCSANAAISHLAETRPAEFARIVRGLLSPEGTAALPSGAVLKRLPDALEVYGAARRRPSLAEFITISTLMDFGVGGGVSFKNGSPTQLILRQNNPESEGLAPNEFKRLLEALYDRRFKVVRGPAGMEDIFDLERYPLRGAPVMITLLWTEQTDLASSAEQKTKRTFHSVRFVGRTPSGEVLVADPSDATTTNNTVLKNPPRIILDTPGHIAKFSADEFKYRFRSAFVPEPTISEAIERLIIDAKKAWFSLWQDGHS